MASESSQQFDLQRLTAPLTTESPCGEDLPSYDSVFSAIGEAGREDDATSPRGVWERDLKRSDWAKVRRLSEEALETRSKDLRLAASLCEAMLHLDGLAGLAQGLRLLVELVEKYWDKGLHPLAEGNEAEGSDGAPDNEFRLNIIASLGGKLPTVVRLLPVTEPGEGVERVFSLADWEETILLERLSVKDRSSYEEAVSSGRPTRSKFLGAVMFSSLEFYQELGRQAQTARSSLAALKQALTVRCAEQAPSLSELDKAVTGVLQLAEKFATEKGGGEEAVSTESETQEAEREENGQAGETPRQQAGSQAGAGGQNPAGKDGRPKPISSRAEAYRMLNRAAEYLMATEPHSPAPYLVKRAVSWGNMSLTELFREIVEDERDLHSILALLGVKDAEG